MSASAVSLSVRHCCPSTSATATQPGRTHPTGRTAACLRAMSPAASGKVVLTRITKLRVYHGAAARGAVSPRGRVSPTGGAGGYPCDAPRLATAMRSHLGAAQPRCYHPPQLTRERRRLLVAEIERRAGAHATRRDQGRDSRGGKHFHGVLQEIQYCAIKNYQYSNKPINQLWRYLPGRQRSRGVLGGVACFDWKVIRLAPHSPSTDVGRGGPLAALVPSSFSDPLCGSTAVAALRSMPRGSPFFDGCHAAADVAV
jgi:hypothetical protein